MGFKTIHEIGRAVALDAVSGVNREHVSLLWRLYTELRGTAIESARLLKEEGRTLENQIVIAKRVCDVAERQAADYPIYIPSRNEERLSDYVGRAIEHLSRGDTVAATASLALAKHYL